MNVNQSPVRNHQNNAEKQHHPLSPERRSEHTDRNGESLKAVDTIGNCQRAVFSLGVSQHMHKITNL